MSDFNYEEFYIPTSLDDNKIVGFERDEILIFFSLTGSAIITSLPILLIGAFFFTYKYKKLKAGKFHFIPNLLYKKLYPAANIKYMPRPFIKQIYGG